MIPPRRHVRPCPRLAPPLLLVLALLGTVAQAQQRPLTGSMMASPAATGPAAAAPQRVTAANGVPPATSPFPEAARTPPAPREVGDATRALLRLQAEGTYAGAALPMLGEQASRSYQRYLDSFTHPIPERFELTLPDAGRHGD